MSSGTLPRIAGLQQILDRCQRLIRVYSVLRGLAEALCVLIACILLGCLIDYFVALPGIVRLGGLVVTLFLTGAVAWKRLVHPLMGNASAEELGAAVDLRFPQLQEAMATLISIDGPNATSSEAGSSLMRDRLEQHVRAQIGNIRPAEVVHGKPTAKRWGLAFLSVLAILVPWLLWPSGSSLLLQRFMMPLANLAAPSNLYFDVPDAERTVAANSEVSFVAIPRWRTKAAGVLPTNVVLEIQAADNPSEDLAMSFDETTSQFTASLPDVRESLRYRVRGGGAITQWFELIVADPPRILTALLQETPPVYTGRPTEIFDGVVGDIHVFERSAIEITLTFNKPVLNAAMEWQSWKPIPPGESEIVVAAELEPPTTPAVLSADGTSAQFHFQANGSGQFEFRVEDALGLTNLNETIRRLIVTTDTPPGLTVTGINDTLEVRPTDVVPLNCQVIDDIGVGELEVHVRKNAEAFRIEPAVGFDRGAVQISHDFQIDLSTLDVHNGDTLTLKVKAADERPSPGPQVVWQGPWTIQIADNAEAIGQKALREADQKLVESLRKLEEQLQQDAAKGNELKDQLHRNWNDEVQQDVRELSEKEQQQGRDLQKLAEQAAAHPLMQKQAEKLAELAQQVRNEVPEKLEEAASAQRDPAAQKIQESVNELNRIREELHRATDEIEKAAKLEQELAELNRLALEAQQLAKESQKLQQQQQDQQPEEGQSKEDLQKQLDEKQHQLQQEQKQLAADLGDLLQRKQELLQAAREAQLDRAAEIAKEAQRLAQQQQQLAEGVNEEARDAARDAQELANELQQARNEADQLGNEIQQQAQDVPRPEVQPLDEAIRDLRQGNLATPQDGIEKSQEQLAKAAEELAEPAAAPAADPNAPPADENAKREEDRKLAEQNAKRQELGKKATDISERLEQIEDKIAAMSEKLGAEPQESANQQDSAQQDGNQPPKDAAQPPAQKPSDTPHGPAAKKSEELPQGEKSDADVGRNLLNELEKMVEAAHETADAVSADRKAENGAKQQSQQAAEKADEAMRHAMAGQFSRSAERMKQSANDASSAAQQLQSQEQQDRREQLQQQGEDFNRMAEVFQQLQENNEAQVAAQQQTQRDVAEAADQLPSPLEELAERLDIPELGLQNQARPAQEAAQAAREGAESGEAASGQMNEAQLQQAGQKAQEAAGQLNRAAQLAQQAAQGHRDPNALIPSEVGKSVSDALQSLKKSAESIDQEAAQRAAAEQAAREAAEQAANQQSPEGQPGQKGKPGEGQPGEGQQGQVGDQPGQQPGEGKPGDKPGKPGEGQPGDGKPGEGQGRPPGKPGNADGKGGQGQQSPSQQPSSAQQMAKAAKSLQDAARGALPNQFSPGQLSSDPGSAAGDPKSEGNVSEFDGKDPNRTSKKGKARGWGKLNDDLDADVSDAGKEVLDNEYSELIRRYRRDLARAGQKSEKKPEAGKP